MKNRLLACLAVLALAAQCPAASPQSPAVGASAPGFRLQDQNGAWVSLEEQRGKWVVLYFYPKDNTPGCTTEACEFRDSIVAFRNAGTVVLGISVDDVASHKQFSERHALPFRILADSGKQVARDYGVLHRALGVMEVARRETFIIDPRGRVAKHYGSVDPKRHPQTVLADLAALKAQQN